MAEKIIIAATLQVDTGAASANLKNFNSNVKDTKASLSGISDTASKTGGAIDTTSGSFSKLKGQISAMPGPLGQASEGVKSLSNTFKALLANPIGLAIAAIVIVLTSLYKAFTSTAEGADKVGFVFDGLKGVVLTVRDTILNVAGAIAKFFSGDFKGALDQGKAAVSGFGDKCVESFNRAYEASKQLDDIEDRMKELDVQRAKGNFLIRESRNLLSDETASLEDKTKALGKVKAFEKDLSDQEVKNAKDRYDAIFERDKAQRESGKLSQDQIDELQAAEIAYYNKKTEAENNIRQLDKQGLTIKKEAAAKVKEIHDAEVARNKQAAADKKIFDDAETERKNIIIAAEKALAEAKKAARLQEIADIEAYGAKLAADQVKADAAETKRLFENEKERLTNKKKLAELNVLDNPDDPNAKIAKLQANLELENSLLAENDLQRLINAKNTSDAIIQIRQGEVDKDQELNEKKKANAESNMLAVANLLGNLSELVGKQTVVGKALAIAQATIEMYKGAVGAYSSVSKIPYVGPVLGVIAAASAIGLGIKNIKAIASVKIPGGSGGGSVPSAPSLPSAPIAPTRSSTTLDQASLNGVGSAVSQQPVKAYMVESEGAQSRERIERLNRASRLGG